VKIMGQGRGGYIQVSFFSKQKGAIALTAVM
jgi:hypothetical protein